MFDIGFAELLVIGIVALIVVGPKDLPGMFRTLGRFTGKMKNMAREFQRAMNDAADEAGVKDISKDLREATSSKSMGLDRLNEAADRFEKWDPARSKGKPPERGRVAAKPTADDDGEAAADLADAPDSGKPAPKSKVTAGSGSTGAATQPASGPGSEERAAKAKKIHENMARKGAERLAAEAGAKQTVATPKKVAAAPRKTAAARKKTTATPKPAGDDTA